MGRWIEDAERRLSCSRCHAVVEVGQRFYYLRRGAYLCELCGSIAEHEQPEIGDIESGVISDLDTLPPEAKDRTLAKMMIAMARKIDNGDVADRDVAPITKEIRQMLMQLRLDFPPAPEEDETEKSRARRARRLLMGGELEEY